MPSSLIQVLNGPSQVAEYARNFATKVQEYALERSQKELLEKLNNMKYGELSREVSSQKL